MSTVIRLGHANAWDYPVGVFVSALEEANEALKTAESGGQS